MGTRCGTYDTLESVWAWEDAFRVVHSTKSCDAVSSSGDTTTVVCRLKVDSEVAEAARNDPGLVCATLRSSTNSSHGLAVDAGQECSYRHWGKMFAPFGHWLGTARPDITIEEMYNDRISETGLERWTRYTQEFHDDVG